MNMATRVKRVPSRVPSRMSEGDGLAELTRLAQASLNANEARVLGPSEGQGGCRTGWFAAGWFSATPHAAGGLERGKNCDGNLRT